MNAILLAGKLLDGGLKPRYLDLNISRWVITAATDDALLDTLAAMSSALLTDLVVAIAIDAFDLATTTYMVASASWPRSPVRSAMGR